LPSVAYATLGAFMLAVPVPVALQTG
jgi:hypothetical protein